MEYQWHWNVFFQISPDAGQAYWILFVKGFAATLAVSAASWIIAFVLGVIVGAARTSLIFGIRMPAYLYVHLFRGVPLLVQLFLWYFVFPEMFDSVKAVVVRTDATYVQFTAVTVCLGLFTSARVAEQVRSGIESLSRGQRSAGMALGLHPVQIYRYVLLPQSMRLIVPPLTSELMNLIKNSSIALTIGFAELTFRAREIGETTFSYFEAFIVTTIVYIAIALTAYAVMARFEPRKTA
ncbi:amino acid ABC transporter permease [Herbaspirillum sp. NPDC101397]|uniref:amino acid ABC transporter permease n=1 Tax=Herbaspirillum sp. NPDC101397 TaxID=3364006 RepID=UPI00383A7092